MPFPKLIIIFPQNNTHNIIIDSEMKSPIKENTISLCCDYVINTNQFGVSHKEIIFS